jgi:hypothetical protein
MYRQCGATKLFTAKRLGAGCPTTGFPGGSFDTIRAFPHSPSPAESGGGYGNDLTILEGKQNPNLPGPPNDKDFIHAISYLPRNAGNAPEHWNSFTGSRKEGGRKWQR